MKRIVFYDFCDLADCMIDKAKNEVDVSAICHFEYASSLLHELIKKNCMVSSIDISDYSFDGYDREYLISLNREHEIIVKPLYSYKKDGYKRDGYLYHEGEFVYIPKMIMGHRIHEESETTAAIVDNKRTEEEFEMFCKFWPKGIAKLILKQYSKGQQSNQV